MALIKEISLLSRGGQGGVTLGKILAYAASYDGYFATAIPKYGAERRGAPISTSMRLSKDPIKRHSQIAKPTDVVALDVSVVPRMIPSDPFNGSGTLTLNAETLPDEYSIYHPEKIGLCNVQKIAQDVGLVKSGSTMIGIPMLGAFIATTGYLTMSSLHKSIDKVFKGSSYLEANHKAVDLTNKNTEIIILEQRVS